jgi:hypothetical protein
MKTIVMTYKPKQYTQGGKPSVTGESYLLSN